MRDFLSTIGLAALVLAAGVAVADPLDTNKKTADMDPAQRDNGLSYTVKCADGSTDAGACEVDKDTYVGWRSFHAHCFQCHGGSAQGTTFAPNLMERFNQHVDFERFDHVLHEGYTGQMGAMPAFGNNPQVLKEVEPLYRYLRARADDALPAGRPQRMKE